MDGLLIIVYTISIALTCMTLGLAIANVLFHRTLFGTWYVVFQACLMLAIAMGFFVTVSSNFFGPKLNIVLFYIFRILAHTTTAFILVILPYFVKYILDKPWGTLQRILFYTLGIIYFAAGLVSVLVGENFYAQIIQTPMFICVYAVCLFIMWKNLCSIEDKKSRDICFTVIVVSLTMIPLAILSLIFNQVDKFSYPVYSLAISIVMLVYFFIRLRLDSERLYKKTKITDKSLDQFKITEREKTVIQLICDGMTNKEIASKLNISVNTVNNHVANIFEKMGARSRVELLSMLRRGPWD